MVSTSVTRGEWCSDLMMPSVQSERDSAASEPEHTLASVEFAPAAADALLAAAAPPAAAAAADALLASGCLSALVPSCCCCCAAYLCSSQLTCACINRQHKLRHACGPLRPLALQWNSSSTIDSSKRSAGTTHTSLAVFPGMRGSARKKPEEMRPWS